MVGLRSSADAEMYPYQMKCARLLLWQICHSKSLFLYLPQWQTKGGKEKLQMKQEQNLKEIKEARFVGERALASLSNVKVLLDSAGNWGLWDMFGGGLLSGVMKHSKLESASCKMEEARHQLQCFQGELKDIEVPTSFKMDICDFLVFCDFFFDGLITDWLVQSKISEAKGQVDDAIIKVKTILHDLNQWESHLLMEEK